MGTPVAASLATRFVLEGPSYVTRGQVASEIVQAAGEGLLDLAIGMKLAKAVHHAKTIGEAADDASRLVRDVARLMEDSSNADLLERAAGKAIEGTIEGVLGGAISSAATTAMDRSTWDQATMATLADLAYSFMVGAAWGATIGGVMGGAIGAFVGKVPEPDRDNAASLLSLVHDLGQAQRFFHFLDADPDKIPDLVKGVAELSRGDTVEAEATLATIRLLHVDLFNALMNDLGPQAPLRKTLQDFQSLKTIAEKALGGRFKNIFKGLEVVGEATASGQTEMRIDWAPGDPFPKLRVSIPPNPGGPASIIVHRELFAYVGSRFEPSLQKYWKRLTNQKLGSWPTMTLTERLQAREAYLQIELWVSDRIIGELELKAQTTTLSPQEQILLDEARTWKQLDERELNEVEKALRNEEHEGRLIDLNRRPYLNSRSPFEAARTDTIHALIEHERQVYDTIFEPRATRTPNQALTAEQTERSNTIIVARLALRFRGVDVEVQLESLTKNLYALHTARDQTGPHALSWDDLDYGWVTYTKKDGGVGRFYGPKNPLIPSLKSQRTDPNSYDPIDQAIHSVNQRRRAHAEMYLAVRIRQFLTDWLRQNFSDIVTNSQVEAALRQVTGTIHVAVTNHMCKPCVTSDGPMPTISRQLIPNVVLSFYHVTKRDPANPDGATVQPPLGATGVWDEVVQAGAVQDDYMWPLDSARMWDGEFRKKTDPPPPDDI